MNKFKIIWAGCGNQSKLWIPHILKRGDTEIIGLVDIKEENAQELGKEFELSCPIFDNICKAIDSTDANLVCNLTTPDAHRDIIITAIQNGLDVITEKPLGATWEDVQKIAEAVKKSNNSLTVMQNRRYLNGIRALREIMNSGVIGITTYIGVDFFVYPLGDDFWNGFRTKIAHPLITDMAIHTFDMARFLLNNADAVSVYCHEFQPKGSLYKGNAGAICIFEMSDGTVFTYDGHWCAEGCRIEWEGAWRVTGTKGSAIWDGENKPYCEIPMPEAEKTLGFKASRYKRMTAEYDWQTQAEGELGPVIACIDEMFGSLVEGKKSETDWSDNIKSMAMVCAAIKSAEEGKKVYLDEFFNI